MNRSVNRIFFVCMLALAFIGYWLYSHAGNYTFNSAAHFKDIILAKGWTILWLLLSTGLIFHFRKREYLPKLVVVLLSAYFMILYGILFLGTEYGMHGHWAICHQLSSGNEKPLKTLIMNCLLDREAYDENKNCFGITTPVAIGIL